MLASFDGATALDNVCIANNTTLASDVTGDGVADLADVTRLMQYLAEWDVTLQ